MLNVRYIQFLNHCSMSNELSFLSAAYYFGYRRNSFQSNKETHLSYPYLALCSETTRLLLVMGYSRIDPIAVVTCI